MQISRIRDKYKQILKQQISFVQTDKPHEQNEEEPSQRQWINIVKRENQKKILTQTNKNKQNSIQAQKQQRKMPSTAKKSNNKMSTEQIIIDIKQKLAQSILNCSRKDAQLIQFQHLIVKKNEEIKLHQKSIKELKNMIESKDSLLIQEKIQQQNLHKEISIKENSIQQITVQNELLKKQITNYAKQIENINQKWCEEQSYYLKVEKEQNKIDALKNKILQLKDDIKRLQFLLSGNEVYTPLLVSLQGKHFLGKPNKQSKQLQYWYPEVLMSGVQRFLKKEQVGYGNKAFAESLTKFIYGLMEKSERTGVKKCKNKFNSRIKQFERKRNHILNLLDQQTQNLSKTKSSKNSRLHASSLKKTTLLNGNSQFKSRDFSICLEKSLLLQKQTLNSAKIFINRDEKNQSKKFLIVEGFQKSVRTHEKHKQHVIMQLIESFCKGVSKLLKLDNKTLAQQKTVELCQWLRQSVCDIYSSHKYFFQDQNLKQTGKWKTIADC